MSFGLSAMPLLMNARCSLDVTRNPALATTNPKVQTTHIRSQFRLPAVPEGAFVSLMKTPVVCLESLAHAGRYGGTFPFESVCNESVRLPGIGNLVSRRAPDSELSA